MATRDTKIVRDVSTSVPIELLNSDAVRLYTHAYPFLVLALFYARFNTTVADPVSSLSQLVLPICILQAIYMIICLPAATSMPPSLPSQPPSTTKPSAQQQQQQQQQQRKKPASTKPSFSLTYFNTKILVSNPPKLSHHSQTDLPPLSQPCSPLSSPYSSLHPS